jgi:uncharacterized protein (TIGR02246 family)
LTAITDQIRDLARRYTAAWCSQDPAQVAAFFSPQGGLRINGKPAAGRAAITEVVRGFMVAFPDMEVRMDSLSSGDGRIIYRWTLAGTHTGPNGTGRSVHISGFEEWQIGEDELIFQSEGHFDEASYQRQLQGLAP